MSPGIHRGGAGNGNAELPFEIKPLGEVGLMGEVPAPRTLSSDYAKVLRRQEQPASKQAANPSRWRYGESGERGDRHNGPMPIN